MSSQIEMRPNDYLVFPVSDYKKRVEGLIRRMQERNLRFLFVSEPDNLCWLCGHETSGYGTLQGLLISSEGEVISFSRLLEESNFLLRTWIPRTRTWLDHEDPSESLARLMQDEGVGEIGLELDGQFLPRRTEVRLRESFQVVNASGIVELGRRKKSEAEIQLLKKIAGITETAMQAGLDAVGEGVRENELAAIVHQAMYQAGGEYPSVPPYIVSGSRTVVGHATWTDRQIEAGDCVFLEIAGCLRRYHTAMMRTSFIGEPPAAIREGETMVLDHLAELKSRMCPGVSCHEIDVRTRDEQAYKHIGATRISRTGYSLGIAFAPSWDEGHILSLVEGESTPLEENMVFHLIPWLQFPGQGAIMGISETVRITKNGAESLFDLPLKLNIA